MHKVNLSLQVIPINTTEAYTAIDRAIEVIQKSGIKYEVQPFSTIMEGDLESLLKTAMAAKEAALKAGADELVLNIQIHLKKGQDVHFEDKTGKLRIED